MSSTGSFFSSDSDKSSTFLLELKAFLKCSSKGLLLDEAVDFALSN